MKTKLLVLVGLASTSAFGTVISAGHSAGRFSAAGSSHRRTDFDAHGLRSRNDYYNGGYWPLFLDEGSAEGPGYQVPQSVTIFYPPPLPAFQTAPTEPAHPVIHEYRRPEDYGLPSDVAAPAPPPAGPIVYLIAFRDKNIRAAMAYWVDQGTIHYLDTDHRQQHAPLSSVDRGLSEQLNRERNVPFMIE